MKIGVFGGSFDPVHTGHLLLAEQAIGALGLDVVLFIPAAIPPHKQEKSLASNENRLRMLELATCGNDRCQVDPCELEREGVSYTVDTLSSLRERHPDDDLFLLIGADSLAEFHTWKDPEEICRLALPVVIERPGSDKVDLKLLSPYVDDPRLQQIQESAFESFQIDLSSTRIRDSAKAGTRFRYQTPRAVEQFIKEKKLYIDG